MEYQWLKQKYVAVGLTAKQVADSYGVDASQIGKMANCHQQAPQRVRYIDLAKILGVEVITLIQHHIRDLTTAQLPKHLDCATAALQAYIKEKSVPPVDYRAIEKALSHTDLQGFVRRIGERKPYFVDATGQAKHIASLLHEGDFDVFNLYVGQPLMDAISEVADETALVAVAGFLRAVLRACHISLSAIKMGEINWTHGSQAALEYKIAIDAERDLDGLKTLVSDPQSYYTSLDKSHLTTRSIDLCFVTETNTEERVYLWVEQYSKILGTGPPPLYDLYDDSKFASHCAVLNLKIMLSNTLDDYVLGIFEQTIEEPQVVKNRLSSRLPALTLFDATSANAADAANYGTLRLSKEKIEPWYANLLNKIDQRKEGFSRADKSNADRNNKSDVAERSPNPPPTVNVNIFNEVNFHKQLPNALAKVLIETNAGNSEHINLRNIVSDMQSDVENLGVVSPEKKTLFQQTLKALPGAVQGLESVSKLVDLFTKYIP